MNKQKTEKVISSYANAEKLASKITNIQRLETNVVFEDILNLYIAVYSFGRQEPLYHEIRNRYNEKEFLQLNEIFNEIFYSYLYPVENKVDYDLLGDIYQELSSNYKKSGLGQFFTPLPVTRLMAEISLGSGKNICTGQEPSCGSGRNCISAFNINNQIIFNAIDLDKVCVKITIVNMHLYSMIGSEVIHGNAISMESYGGYRLTLGKPIIENMLGNKWNELDQDKQTSLKTVNDYQTIIIEEIKREDIYKNCSIYFYKICENIDKIKQVDSQINKVFSFLDDFNEQKEIIENNLVPVSASNDFQSHIKNTVDTFNNNITIEIEIEIEIEKPITPEVKTDFEFKKPKKYDNQISLFDI